MRKLFALPLLLLASAAFAQSQFRQRIRHIEIHGDVTLRDDGGVVTEITCIADAEHDLVDGGTWPLKVRLAQVDGGLPNPVIDRCARTIEARNALDGGFQ